MKAKGVGIVVRTAKKGRFTSETHAVSRGSVPMPTKVKTRNISLPSALDIQIEQRVRSGLYGNASDVVRAGLRALLREEMSERYQHFKGIMAALPRDPITPEIEQDIERRVKTGRTADTKRAAPNGRP